MSGSPLTGPRLAAVFLLGVVLFNYPLLSVFDIAGAIFGIPLLYAYLFAAWTLLIALMAAVIEWLDR